MQDEKLAISALSLAGRDKRKASPEERVGLRLKGHSPLPSLAAYLKR